MNYRREIDGLRAVAVLPVVLFHGGFEFISGGYAGVDIFFVISGYLITALIVQDLEKGRFSILEFYERRARRILPALFVMLAVCSVMAAMWMAPSQMTTYSKALASVALFASNIFFWRNSGYFDTGSESNPLLHTWSLAVEEQFYILFPLFMLAAWRFGRSKVFWMLVLAALVSLLLTEPGWRFKAWANFYLLPTRAWELLAGSLCALWLTARPQRENDWLAAAGLAAILVSFFLFDRNTPFPSFWTVLPVGGTVLLILYAGPATLTGRLLAMKPFVGIGLISYSVYLWHQPLLAFLRIRSLDAPSAELLLFAALMSLPIGYLSWRFVEQSWRKGQGARFRSLSTARVLGCALAGLVVVVSLGAWGAVSHGFPGRFDPALVAIDNARDDTSPLTDACYIETPAAGGIDLGPLPRPECTYTAADGSVDVAILGDSHAEAISYPLMQELKDQGVGVTTLSLAACVPFDGYWHTRARCDESVKQVLDYVKSSSLKTVIIAGRYSLYVRDDGFDNGLGGVEPDQMGPKTFADPLVSGSGEAATLANGLDMLARGVRSYLDMGKTVILVYPIPEAGWSVPDRYFKERMSNPQASELTIPMPVFEARNGDVIRHFDGLSDPNLAKVDPRNVLCRKEDGVCVNASGDDVFYYDDDHLSLTGARLLTGEIVSLVLNSLGRRVGEHVSAVR